jgi:hypothetical protein
VSLSSTLSAPWFTGDATSTETRLDVALGGHAYMVDTKYLDRFGRQSVEMIRQQSDDAARPAEQSLNPAGLWRRAVESWHLGAGQEWLDKPESSPFRFHTSKGVDPWTKYGLTLLPATALGEASTDTNLFLTVGGGRLYMSEGQTVRVTGVGDTTFATATGLPANTVTGLASDGTNVYAASAGGLYSATGTAFSSYATGAPTLVRYAHGRLIVAIGKAIYNVTASGGAITAGTVLLDHPNSGWSWTDATEGRGVIYLSGYAGDKSIIYRTTIKEDGTGLDVAIPAVPLPDGEIARTVQGYLNFVVIGTDKGIRFAVGDDEGNLTLGSLIPTTSPVYCAEGQDRFVWYGLSNYDAASTGLGRLDLANFTADLTPAYASDLMATGQGTVQSAVTYLNKRWFTVSGLGAYQEQTTKVASGSVNTGRITYGLPDTKTAVAVDVRHDPLPASAEVELFLSADSGTSTSIGASELDGSSVSAEDAFTLNQQRGTYFTITAVIAGDMTLRRITLHADPAATRTVILQVPLLLRHSVRAKDDTTDIPVDVQAELEYLDGLFRNRHVVNYQEGDQSYRVVLDDFTWQPDTRPSAHGLAWEGTYIARLKEL